MWQSTHGDLPNSCVAAAEKGSQRKLGYIVLFRHCCVRLYGGRSTELSAQNGSGQLATSCPEFSQIGILVNTQFVNTYVLVLALTADFRPQADRSKPERGRALWGTGLASDRPPSDRRLQVNEGRKLPNFSNVGAVPGAQRGPPAGYGAQAGAPQVGATVSRRRGVAATPRPAGFGAVPPGSTSL